MKSQRGRVLTAVSFLLLVLCVAWPMDGVHAGGGAARQRRRTVKLRLLVKDPDGKVVGGARINVWHDTGLAGLASTRPPDYQVEETRSNGLTELEVDAEKSSSVIVEVNKGALAKQVTIELTGPVVSQVIELAPISQDIFDSGKKVVLKFRVESESGGAEGKGEPLAGVRILLRYFQGSPRVVYEGVTGPDGEVKIPVAPISYSVEAVKEGYASGGEVVSPDNDYRGRTFNVRTIKLKKSASREAQKVKVVVEVRNSETKLGVDGARITLTGRTGVTSRLYTGETNAEGIAELVVEDSGPYDLEISQQYFEPHIGEVRILSGEKEKGLGPYFLKEKPKTETAQDTVKVTVLAGDKKNAPLSAASVRLDKKSVNTDEKGGAILYTAFGEATHVIVTASAKGYRSETKSIPVRRGVRYADAVATATIILQPGEDAATEDAPVALVVEVRDSFDNKLLKDAAVSYYTVNGALIYGYFTNEAGEQDFNSDSNAKDQDVALLRKGLKVNVRRQGYVERDSLVTADLLQPSASTRRITVYLERSWEDLRKAVGTLGGKVANWNNDVRLVSEKVASVEQLVKQATERETRATELSNELSAGVILADVPGRVSGATLCRRVAEVKQILSQYETDVLAKEDAVKKLLDDATSAAASCQSPSDASAVKNGYNTAVKLTGEIGAIVNKARPLHEELMRMARESKGRLKINEVEKRVTELGELARGAEQAVTKATTDERGGTALSAGLSARHATLSGELVTLRTTYGINSSGTGLPKDLRQSLDDMAELLGRRNNDVMSGPNPNGPALVKASAEKIKTIAVDAERALNSLKNAGTQCQIEPTDESFEKLGNAIVSATVELTAASNLPSKAEDCMRRGACQPLLADVRGLLERDELEAAETRINAARAQSCDVSEAESELDYWRTVRQTANLIASSLDSCRFQEALDLGMRFPPGVKSRPLVAYSLEAARRGVQARQRITELRESARRDVARTNQVAAAHPYVAQAEQAAQGFPCLIEEVARFRDEYKITALIHKTPPLEEQPEEEKEDSNADNPAKRRAALDALDGAEQSDRPDNRPPDQRPTNEATSAGSLQMANPWVKDAVANVCCGGRNDYAYGLTTASRKDSFPPGDGGDMTIAWNFAGVPNGALTPGQEYRITVTGSFSASLPNRSLDPPASAGVRIAGDVDVSQNQNAFISRETKRDGVYVFRVRPDAKSVTIELGADYGIATFAVYRFGEVKK